MDKLIIRDTSNKKLMTPFYNLILQLSLLIVVNLFYFNIFTVLISLTLLYVMYKKYVSKMGNIEVDDIEANLRYKDYVENIVKEETIKLGRFYKYNNSHITTLGEDSKSIFNIYLDYGLTKKSKITRQVHSEIKEWFYATRKQIKTNEYRYRVFVNGKPISLKRTKKI